MVDASEFIGIAIWRYYHLMALCASGAASPATLSKESERSYSLSRAEYTDPCHAHPDFFTPQQETGSPTNPARPNLIRRSPGRSSGMTPAVR